MDQEKFEQHLMDYLFDELDEVTAAAMRRKIDADAACRELEAGLQATIQLAQLPQEDPSDDLEARILAATDLAQQEQPLHKKLLQMLSWAGSYAMRPQLAMAAILMMVVGSSLLLLRARPGSVADVVPTKDQAPTPVPPEADADDAPAEAVAKVAPSASVPVAPPPPPAAADLDAEFARGNAAYRAGNFAEAKQAFGAVAASGHPQAATAALFEARAIRSTEGCAAAIPKYLTLRGRFPGLAEDAAWEQADCHRQIGQSAEWAKILRALAKSKRYATRANAELSNAGQTASVGEMPAAKEAPPPQKQARSVPPAPPAATTKKAPPPPPAAPPPAKKRQKKRAPSTQKNGPPDLQRSY